MENKVENMREKSSCREKEKCPGGGERKTEIESEKEKEEENEKRVQTNSVHFHKYYYRHTIREVEAESLSTNPIPSFPSRETDDHSRCSKISL